MAKTVVALFNNIEQARAAVHDLEENHFPKDNISLIAYDREGKFAKNLNLDFSQAGESLIGPQDPGAVRDGESDAAAKGMGIGAALGGLAGMLVGLGALMVPGIGPVLAAGPLLATLGGAGIGAVTGGMIGALTDNGIPDSDARQYVDGIRHGGSLVLVSTNDEDADRASMIINRNHPVDVGQQSGGWDGFNEEAEHSAFDDRPVYREREPSSQLDYAPGARSYLQGKPVTAYDEDREQMDLSRDSSNRTSSWRTYESRFRHHYDLHYANREKPWEDLRDAYRFGFEMAQDPGYSNTTWVQIQKYVRDMWDTRHIGRDWDFYEAAIQDGWEAGHIPA